MKDKQIHVAGARREDGSQVCLRCGESFFLDDVPAGACFYLGDSGLALIEENADPRNLTCRGKR